MSAHPKLNTSQARHIRAYLHLLAEELAVERTFLPPGPGGDERRRAMDLVRQRIDALLGDLGLDAPAAPAPGRRLWALAEIWLSRVEDLRPRGLVPYGKVGAGVSEVLDPGIDALATALEALSRAASGDG